MKKVMMITLLLAGATLQAQPPGPGRDGHRNGMHEKMQQLTPQQRAELKTKKMMLDLDLTKAQQSEILKLNLELAIKRENNKPEKTKKSEITPNELFERTSAQLDEKIATKRKLQSILTKEQFEKFEKSRHRKEPGHRHHLGRKKR